MSTATIKRAISTLRSGTPGLESVGGTEGPARSPDEVTDAALKHLGGAGTGNWPWPRNGPPSVDEAKRALAYALVEEGRTALKQVATKGMAVSLSRSQLAGLEAIVKLTGRPSLLVQGGKMIGQAGDWSSTMKIAGKMIEQSIASVGRVNVPGINDFGYLGTAFMVAEDLAITNRHVVTDFAGESAGRWEPFAGLQPTVDFRAESGSAERRTHRVVEIVAVHADDFIDLAILRLAKKSEEGVDLPAPLALNTNVAQVAKGRSVYVIGYPAIAGDDDASAVSQIFNDVLQVKRIAPGEIVDSLRDGLRMTHDCSTLRGSSGSCVVDMTDHRVLGLHNSGLFLNENRAASLAHIRGDPLIANKGFNYV